MARTLGSGPFGTGRLSSTRRAPRAAETNRPYFRPKCAVRLRYNQSISSTRTGLPTDGISSFRSPGSRPRTTYGLLPLISDRKPVKFLASPAEEMHGNFSPDEHLVAYTSNESGRFQVDVQTFPLSDKKWQVSTNSGYEPRWRDDGRRSIIYPRTAS